MEEAAFGRFQKVLQQAQQPCQGNRFPCRECFDGKLLNTTDDSNDVIMKVLPEFRPESTIPPMLHS
jgi:hypothetical protein